MQPRTADMQAVVDAQLADARETRQAAIRTAWARVRPQLLEIPDGFKAVRIAFTDASKAFCDFGTALNSFKGRQ